MNIVEPTHVFENIEAIKMLEQLTSNSQKTVCKNDYECFLSEFVFYKLKGYSFGKAFCDKFGFNDTFLKNLSDKTAREHIEKLGYIK